VDTNIRLETTFLNGAKDGNENKKGYGLMGKKGKKDMKQLRR
jgi:hypothetical protein